MIVSYSTHLSTEKANQPIVGFCLVVWLQSTLWEWLPKSLVFQGCQVGLNISKQLQAAQPFCQTFCFCQTLYKYFNVWYLEPGQRISQRMNTSALAKDYLFSISLPSRVRGWVRTGEELKLLRSDADLSPQEASILQCWSNAAAVVAAVWHGHTWGSLGFHAESLKNWL